MQKVSQTNDLHESIYGEVPNPSLLSSKPVPHHHHPRLPSVQENSEFPIPSTDDGDGDGVGASTDVAVAEHRSPSRTNSWISSIFGMFRRTRQTDESSGEEPHVVNVRVLVTHFGHAQVSITIHHCHPRPHPHPHHYLARYKSMCCHRLRKPAMKERLP